MSTWTTKRVWRNRSKPKHRFFFFSSSVISHQPGSPEWLRISLILSSTYIFLNESFHLVFCLPLRLFPSNGASTILLRGYHSSLICPYRFSLFSVIFFSLVPLLLIRSKPNIANNTNAIVDRLSIDHQRTNNFKPYITDDALNALQEWDLCLGQSTRRFIPCGEEARATRLRRSSIGCSISPSPCHSSP